MSDVSQKLRKNLEWCQVYAHKAGAVLEDLVSSLEQLHNHHVEASRLLLELEILKSPLPDKEPAHDEIQTPLSAAARIHEKEPEVEDSKA